MPAKNTTKKYIEGGYYHIYNRGVEKRIIFLDQQDYSTFVTYLREYLLPKNTDRKINNFAGEITLLSYCLMPNHWHFLIKQKTPGAMDKFMNSLSTRYVMYFNKKYKRIGSLYQGVYKAVLVEKEEHLLQLSRYLHKQALAVPSIMGSGQPSSYPNFISAQKMDWVKPEEILHFFTQSYPQLSYKSFIGKDENTELIFPLIIEDED